jgi:hypothetical protein
VGLLAARVVRMNVAFAHAAAWISWTFAAFARRDGLSVAPRSVTLRA